MKVSRGNIVLLNMPFSTGDGSKIRPAIVVQSDQKNARLTNTIVAAITRNISRVSEPTQMLLAVGSPDAGQTGLLADSAITCENLFTVGQSFVLKKIGDLPSNLLPKLDSCLKSALGIG